MLSDCVFLLLVNRTHKARVVSELGLSVGDYGVVICVSALSESIVETLGVMTCFASEFKF